MPRACCKLRSVPRPKKDSGTHPELGLPEVRKLWQTEGLFSDHYLKARLQTNAWWPSDAGAEPVWRFCRELYEKRYLACAKNNEAFTRQELLDKILEKLGFAWTDNLGLPDQDAEPDYILFSSAEEKEKVIEAGKPQRYAASVGILEAKKVNHPLSQISKHQRRYPHQQIRDYLSEAQVLTWSILTNGNEWRLYTRDAKPSQFFGLNFEVAIKSLEDFKVFLSLFSAAAFARDARGKCRLDQIREAALATQAELEADLRARIFTIVEILANGFLERPENQITDADLPQLYENCLIYLYRLLFILYAEGRLLLPVEPKSRKYYKQLSLARLLTPLKNYTEFNSQTQTRFYRDIHALSLVINGSDQKANDEFGVPRYNGGLFDPDRYPRLQQWAVADAVLAEVLRQLMFTPEKGGQKFVPFESVDYADLSVQQLGSIYEGLLEHHFVRENGKVKLTTDKGERKATGTYYTPDYIVKYIVENTLGPLLAEIEKLPDVRAGRENSFAAEVLKLNICDPAMGSGHFLVEATIYLADHIVYHPTTKFQAEFSKGVSQEETELSHWRRRVVETCIYGVDLNPLAVELAKLSLWLTTISSDQPLNFLDHHLRCGNSLIGARLDQLGSLPKKKGRAESKQMRFTFGTDFKRAVAETIRQIHEIEDVVSLDMDTVKNKELRWQIEILPRLAPYKKVADLWTETLFDGPLTEDAYLTAASEILVQAESNADSLHEPAARYGLKELAKLYFHWELEFPEAFLNDDGSPKTNPGFDAIIGNPPYVSVTNIEAKTRQALLHLYQTATGRFDLYIVFTERGLGLLRNGGRFCFIEPIKFAIYGNGKPLRELLLLQTSIEQLVDVSQSRVFPDPTTYPCLPVVLKTPPLPDHKILCIAPPSSDPELIRQPKNQRVKRLFIPQSRFLETPEHVICLRLSDEIWDFVRKLRHQAGDLGELFEIEQCIRIGSEAQRRKLVLSEEERSAHKDRAKCRPVIDGENLSRYTIEWDGRWLLYLPEQLYNPKSPDILDQPKLLVKRIAPRLTVVPDPGTGVYPYYPLNTIYALIPRNRHSRSLYFHTAVLNSKLLDWFYKLLFEAIAIRGGYIEFREYLKHLPLRPIEFRLDKRAKLNLAIRIEQLYSDCIDANCASTMLAFIEEHLAANPNRLEHIHDVLSILAEKMENLNIQKQTAAKTFLADLKDFHNLEARRLTPKTKLDEFWKLETAALFDHLRANKIKFKEFDEEKIRARFLKAKDKLVPLAAQIHFTDELIDQIVYRLYGLTEDEIQIVEGRR